MIEGADPLLQSIYGTLLTWGLTALGAAMVFFVDNNKCSVLDASLGFAAGVMTAASFWSLLAPAIAMAAESGTYGNAGQFAFFPVAIGFAIGAFFVYEADYLMSSFGFKSIEDTLTKPNINKRYDETAKFDVHKKYDENIWNPESNTKILFFEESHVKQRRWDQSQTNDFTQSPNSLVNSKQWKRIFLMIVAITVHNIPEGMAVGVGFSAIGKSPQATFNKAKNLAIGIGIQNFPEGMAVSIPLRAAGFSALQAFWWGQLSGMVEPFAGILGSYAMTLCAPLLPYTLSFAAGAMIFVVFDDIIPEAQKENGKVASIWAVIGFIVMMCLDVGLG